MRGTIAAVFLCAALLQGCSRREEGTPPAPARPPTSPAPAINPAAPRVTFLDAQDRPLLEARLARLTADAFDAQGRLRDEAVAASPDRLRVLVEDPAVAEVSVSAPPSEPLVLPLNASAGRRTTRPFLLLGDREDLAAAGGKALSAAPGGRLEIRIGGAVAGVVPVGPAAVHEIPIRFVAVGAPLPDLERAIDRRLAQANLVWEPFGRRFKRGALVRLQSFPGLVLIRGRAAGADAQGRPSRCGLLLDGKDVSVPAAWRNDGAPMTPKATARALIEKMGKSFQVEVYDGLFAGDREAVVLHVRRRDGTPVRGDRLVEGGDVAQSVTPLPADPGEGLEAAPSASLLSLEEIALLASGRGAPSEGFDVFIVPSLRSLQARPAFKVYPDEVFPAPLAGSAVVSWSILDGRGRFPYGLARVAGEMLLPPGVRPGPDDTLFAEPLSEAPGVAAHKRVSAATGAKIAERGRGLPGKK